MENCLRMRDSSFLVGKTNRQAHTGESKFDEVLLIEYTLAGDLDAFNQLVLAYQNTAYNLAYRMLAERTSAEDAVQVAFLSAYLKLNKFCAGSFKSWLLRIVTNTCYDELRRQKRQPIIPLYPTDRQNEEIESPDWLEDPGETPEEASLLRERSAAIQKCLDALDLDFRIVVVLVDVLQLGYAEAAETIGIPLGTVKSRLRRARKKLRYSLKEYGDLIPEHPNLEEKRVLQVRGQNNEKS